MFSNASQSAVRPAGFNLDTMLCSHPQIIRNPRLKTPDAFARTMTLKRLFSKTEGCREPYVPAYVEIACGSKCPLCLEKKTARTICKLVAESYAYNQICYFVTLTIDDLHMSRDFSVHRSHLVDNLQRKLIDRSWRYYFSAEYGSDSDRPHYHGLIYNVDRQNDLLEFLTLNWPLGTFKTDECNLRRFRYTANAHVNKCSHIPYYQDDDVLLRCKQPFVMQSQKLGEKYFSDNAREIYEHGFCEFDGIPFPLSDSSWNIVYKELGIDPTYERFRREVFRPPDFDGVEYFARLAKRYNYVFPSNPQNEDFAEFSRYLQLAREREEREYYNRFINKTNPIKL